MQRRIGGIGDMKVFCEKCGIHFPEDFEETFKPPCNFWGDMGMATIPDDLKRKLWDWLCSVPSDEIAIRTNIAIGIEIRTALILEEDKFENKINGYTELSEEQKKIAQKTYFREMKRGTLGTLLKNKKEAKEVVN